MTQPNDGTEDFDTRCTATESCDCDECMADDDEDATPTRAEERDDA